jgi:hypothetical protein
MFDQLWPLLRHLIYVIPIIQQVIILHNYSEKTNRVHTTFQNLLYNEYNSVYDGSHIELKCMTMTANKTFIMVC